MNRDGRHAKDRMVGACRIGAATMLQQVAGEFTIEAAGVEVTTAAEIRLQGLPIPTN